VPQGHGEHILVVDDEEMLAYLEQELLSSLGYAVTMTTSGKDGLEKLLAEPSAYDAVITDQTMPDVTGIQLAVEIMAIRPDLPIIICTGYSDILDEEKAAQMHIAAFLNKPIRRDILARTLCEVLDKKTDNLCS
jgi:CheY-like chemotaxis protein